MVNEVKNKVTLEIPVEIMKTLTNDQKLGRRIRALYYSLKEKENADSKRND